MSKKWPLELDRYDRLLLSALQRDGRATSSRLAERVGLSVSPCWRRVRRLEEEGVIDRYVALLDARALGLAVTAFVHVSLENHHPDTLAAFDRMVRESPEVMECYAMSGQDDYLLKVVAADMDAYEHFLTQQLLAVGGVRTANTGFVLKTRKHTTELPV